MRGNLLIDRLNDVIDKTEAILCAMNYGVHASVPLPPHANGTPAALWYRKMGRLWGLVVEHGNDQWEPLNGASKRLRMASVPLFPKLIDAVREEAEKESEELARILADTEVWLAQLEEKWGPP